MKYRSLLRYPIVALGVTALGIGGAFAATTYAPPSQQSGSPNPPPQATAGHSNSGYGTMIHHRKQNGMATGGSDHAAGGMTQSPSAQQSVNGGGTSTD